MDAFKKDKVPMLPTSYLQDEYESRQFRRSSRIHSAPLSIPMNPPDYYESENDLAGHSGPLCSERATPFMQMSDPSYVNHKNENLFKDAVENNHSMNGSANNDWPGKYYGGKNEHLLRSGQLGMCDDPYCTTCPTYFKGQRQNTKTSGICNPKFHNVLYGDAKGWVRRTFSSLNPYIPGVMNPHAKIVRRWNKFFVISCLVAVFLDPLFFFLLSVRQDYNCIIIDWTMTKAIVVLRSMTDFIYLMNMLLQFRLAYVAPESRVVGFGDLVDHPKIIALNYLSGYFLLDFFVVLPLPQILIMLVLPEYMGSSGANSAKDFLRLAILIQYIPRLYRFLPLLAGQSASGFIFESAWANFVINLLMFVLSGHIVGSCWYLFGLQRVNQCLSNACRDSGVNDCMKFIDCGHGNEYESFENDSTLWGNWTNNANASACFDQSGNFNYGIYFQTAPLTTEPQVTTRYLYSFFWGFQQISTFAGNQVPSYFIWEVLFTMASICLGLFLFALLVGNMQNFLLSLGRRKLEMSLRRRDVERWMSHRLLPEELRRQVRQSERYHWAATGGVNELTLYENLPEDLQRDIRRHLFKFVKKVRIFAVMDEPILDAIRDRLRQRTYIKGSKILVPGGIVDKMVFIVRGKVESIGEDMNTVPLSEGDVCGEELLTWCLEHSSVNREGSKVRFSGYRLLSNRMARCSTNVEAFILRVEDLEEVTRLFSRFLRNSRVQGAIRYESPYWRSFAAIRIQVAWRYRNKRLNRANISDSNFSGGQYLIVHKFLGLLSQSSSVN